jgi:imidazolonepropionase-like amidohydrolase
MTPGTVVGSAWQAAGRPPVRVAVTGEVVGALSAAARRGLDDRAPTPSGPDAASAVFEATGLWMLPGVVDCHTHLAWHAFAESDRETQQRRRETATADALGATLRGGVTAARDAGGLTAADLESIRGTADDLRAPLVQLSGTMLGRDHAGRAPGSLAADVAAIAASGSQWVKVMATGGLGASAESALDPVFSHDEIVEICTAAASADLRVMAHAWGGPAVAWLVEAGVASIEHGIHLTAADAALAAAHGVVFVPTVAVYRETAEAARTGEIPAEIAERAARAADAHPAAVMIARDAGMTIALGTDAGTPRQHGANLAEIAALMDAGLPAPEALAAATGAGAALLGLGAEQHLDAVLLDSDTSEPETFRRDNVVAVIQAGRLVHIAERALHRIRFHPTQPPYRTEETA